MLDQCFTAENFRTIFDLLNRRGVYLEARFFPQVDALTRRIKACMGSIRDLKRKRSSLPPEDYSAQLKALNDEMGDLRERKEKLLTAELEGIANQISRGNLQISLTQASGPGKKMNYVVDETPATFFALKQLQRNVQTIYGVKQSNRSEIVSQLSGILADKFPKYVIRTDIKDFYESIPQEALLKTIDADALLALPSRSLLRQILNRYRDLSRSKVGIPRGIGISAYLAELHMRAFDAAISAHPELLYYARYVDDMVIMFAPRPNLSVRRLEPFVRKQAAEQALPLNRTKTIRYDLSTPRLCQLEYLGYKLTFGEGSVGITLSDKRIAGYKNRIKRSFDAYLRRQRFDEKRARRLLVRRIQFLTGNTRLSNNKKHVMTGIYYSNSLLSGLQDLEVLDQSLKSRIDSLNERYII
jgi:hypothetical protein